MADTVNLFGSKVPKGAVIAGGLVVGAAVLYGFYKNRQSASSSSTGTASSTAPATSDTAGYSAGYAGTSDPYPADGTVGNESDPYSTDPSSGMTYGDEGQFSTGYGALDTYGDTSGYGGYYAGTAAGETGYSTNGQWAQAAEDYLTTTVGADANTVAAALGKYITGQAITSDQISVVEQAIAFTGYPPVNGTDGYPPSIRQQNSPAGGGDVQVPNVVGLDVAQASQVLNSAGLKASGPGAVQGVTHTVTSQSPKAGSQVASGTTVTLSYKSSGAPAASQVTIPNVTGMDVEQATVALRAAGLKASGPAAQKGVTHVVTGTSPKVGSRVPKGSTVKLNYRTQK